MFFEENDIAKIFLVNTVCEDIANDVYSLNFKSLRFFVFSEGELIETICFLILSII